MKPIKDLENEYHKVPAFVLLITVIAIVIIEAIIWVKLFEDGFDTDCFCRVG
jgi:hypothetical protein